MIFKQQTLGLNRQYQAIDTRWWVTLIHLGDLNQGLPRVPNHSSVVKASHIPLCFLNILHPSWDAKQNMLGSHSTSQHSSFVAIAHTSIWGISHDIQLKMPKILQDARRSPLIQLFPYVPIATRQLQSSKNWFNRTKCSGKSDVKLLLTHICFNTIQQCPTYVFHRAGHILGQNPDDATMKWSASVNMRSSGRF